MPVYNKIQQQEFIQTGNFRHSYIKTFQHINRALNKVYTLLNIKHDCNSIDDLKL